MDLELGLKITHTVDDHVSSANFRIANDKSGPVFVSKETESMFILTGHLKGYRRERVYIDINEDGTRIGISGEKPVQETVMSGWMMYKKEVEMRGFRKVFRILDGVVLDRIKATFYKRESTLTIVMPKSVKGMRGVGIEEVKEDEVDMRSQQLTQPPAAEETATGDKSTDQVTHEVAKPSQQTQVIAKHDTAEENTSELPKLETPKAGNEEHVRSRQESGESSKLADDTIATQQEAQVEHEKNADGIRKEGDVAHQSPRQESIEQGSGSGVEEVAKKEERIKEKEEGESSELKEQSEVADEKSSGDVEEKSGLEKSNRLCSPFIVAGSALIVSLVMLAINRIRSRKR